MSLDESHRPTAQWREGAQGESLSGRFAAVRVRPAHLDAHRREMRPQEWRLIEWPAGPPEPVKCFLSTAPHDAIQEQLAFVTTMRRRIERDYQELKQDFGLGHYEGRGWRGFHHYATPSIAAYVFLMAQRLELSSIDTVCQGHSDEAAEEKISQCPVPAVPANHVPRAQRHVPDSMGTLPALRHDDSEIDFMTQ